MKPFPQKSLIDKRRFYRGHFLKNLLFLEIDPSFFATKIFSYGADFFIDRNHRRI